VSKDFRHGRKAVREDFHNDEARPNRRKEQRWALPKRFNERQVIEAFQNASDDEFDDYDDRDNYR
jgi:hypothetical protein